MFKKIKHWQKHNKILSYILASIAVIILCVSLGFGLKGANSLIEHYSRINQIKNDPQLMQEIEWHRQQHRFIRKYGKIAKQNYQKNHEVLPSILLAQASLESNFGTSKLYKNAHNIFGMKGAYNKQFVKIPTGEVKNGKNVTVNAPFRKYPNDSASVQDYSNALYKIFLKEKGITNYRTDAYLLQKNKYATDPSYPTKLINYIKKYHFYKYDPPKE